MIEALPSTWAAVPLKAVCEINPRTKPELKSNNLVSFVPMAAVSEHSGSIVASETRLLEEVQKGFTPFQSGDVLFAKITPCMENGKAAIARDLVNGQGYGSTEFHVLRPSSLVTAEWLFAIIRTAEFRRAAAASFQGAVGQQRVTSEFLQRFRIPLPPLSEQQRIVEILQEAEEIRRLRAQAEVKTAELITALFHARFNQQREHAHVPLHTLAHVVSGVAIGRKAKGMMTEVPYMRVANVQAGYMDLTELKTTPASEQEIAQYALQKGDVLLTEGGDYDKLGRGALWQGQVSPCIHQNHVFRVRPNHEKLLPQFFAHYLQSARAKSYFLRCAKKTTNLASINLTQLMALPVPVVPLEQQKAFEAEIEAAASTSTQGSDRLFSSLNASLSAHAFTGQLTEEWREKRREQLTAESAERDRLLASSSSRRLIISGIFKTKVEATVRHRINQEALSADQQALLHAIEDHFTPPKLGQVVWFTAELLSRLAGGAWTGNARASQNLLAVLVTRGLVLAASREQVDEITEETVFGTAYRLPMRRYEPDSSEEGEPFPGDFGRQTEMERLAERLYKMRMLP